MCGWVTQASCGTAVCLAGRISQDPCVHPRGLRLVTSGAILIPLHDGETGMHAMQAFLGKHYMESVEHVFNSASGAALHTGYDFDTPDEAIAAIQAVWERGNIEPLTELGIRYTWLENWEEPFTSATIQTKDEDIEDVPRPASDFDDEGQPSDLTEHSDFAQDDLPEHDGIGECW